MKLVLIVAATVVLTGCGGGTADSIPAQPQEPPARHSDVAIEESSALG